MSQWHYHSLIVVWDAAIYPCLQAACVFYWLDWFSMCIRMKHFSVYIASAGSIFTCGHLSPLVLPNTLANEAMVCFHCLRLLWRVSLYYFIHNFHSLPLKMFQLSSVWHVHVCVSHLLRNVVYFASNFCGSMKDEKSYCQNI